MAIRPYCLLAIPAIAAAILVYGWPVAADNDIFLHLKAGEMTLVNGPLLVDLFTYTAAGLPDECWHSWLGQVIFYLTYLAGGFLGLKILSLALLWISLAAMSLFAARRTGNYIPALLAACVGLLIHHHVHILRPLLFGETLFSVSLFWLLASNRALSWKNLAALAGIGALWANLHGSAVILFLLVTAFAVGDWLCSRRWATLLAPLAALLGTFLNPKGPMLYTYALELTRRGKEAGNWEWGSARVLEWLPQFGGPLRLSLHLDVPSLVIILGTAAMARHLWLRKQNAEWRIVLPTLVALVLPWVSVRHVTYLSLPAAWLITELWREKGKLVWELKPRVSTGAAVALSFAVLFLFRFHRSFDVTPSVEKTAKFMADSKLTGNIFSDPAWANYLTFRNYPTFKVARDTRTLLHWDFYAEANRLWDQYGTDAWDILVERLGEETDFVLMHSWRVHFPLDPRQWIVIYENNHARVAMRRNLQNRENLSRLKSYYQGLGIPFDVSRGFDTREVLLRFPHWFDQQREVMKWGLWPQKSAIDHWRGKQRDFYESRKHRSAPLG